MWTEESEAERGGGTGPGETGMVSYRVHAHAQPDMQACGSPRVRHAAC